MKASELRIGNYVNFFNEKCVLDAELFLQLLKYTTPFEPIGLRRLELLNFGFKEYEKDCRTFFTKGKFKLELSTSGNVYYGKLHIAYVHRLQNLYFFLKGEELTD